MADAQANIGIGVDISEGLAAIRQLQREISAFHTSMAKGGALANAESMRLSQNLINTINASGQFSAGMSRISSSTESFTNALEKNKLSMSQYFKYAGGASRSFGKMFSREFDTVNRVAQERVKDLQTQYISMGRDANGALQAIKVRPLALDMNDLGTKVQMVAQRQQVFNQLLKQGSTNLLNFGKNTQWAGRQLMVGFTIPLTIFGATAAREFQKLEEQAVKFRRVYGDMFTTDADTEKALKNVRELADEFTKYGIAVEKTVGLAAKVAQMGNVGADLTAQVTQATRLAVLGGLEQEEALDTTISLTNAFGIAAEDLAGKIAFLNAAENQTILAIEDFNEAIPKAGSVVQQLGGDVEDLAFFLTAMREGGINASQAANALKSSLGRLINPTEAAKERLRGFGIDIVGIVEGNAGNLKNTVMALAVELDKLDPLQRARAIEQLFGKFQFARMSTMFQNIVKEGSQANKVLDLTKNSTRELAIIAERELKRVEDSPAFKLQKQMEKLRAELAPVGAEFIKAVTPIIEFGTRILKAFNQMGEGGKQFVVILTAVAGVVAPAALMAFGLIANGVANLIKFFALLGRGFSTLSGSSRVLGTGTEYLTQQQLEAAAVAASLGQSHSNLIQVFSAEAGAVRNLTVAYRQALIAQSAFRGSAAAAGVSLPKPRGYADGGLIVGPGTGTSDSIPAMVSDGEFIMNAKRTKQYLPFLQLMAKGKLPGFASPDGGTQVSLGPGTKPIRPEAVELTRELSGSVGDLDTSLLRLADKLESTFKRFERVGVSAEEATERIRAAASQRENAQEQIKTLGAYDASGTQSRVESQLSRMVPQQLHQESIQRMSASEAAAKYNDGSAASKFIGNWNAYNPDAEVDIKSMWTRKGSQYANKELDPNQSASGFGMPVDDAINEFQTFAPGIEKYEDSIVAGGGSLDDPEVVSSFEAYDQKMIELQQAAKERQVKFFVDSREDIERLVERERTRAAEQGTDFDEGALRSSVLSYEEMDEQAASVLSPKGQGIRNTAKAKARSARVRATKADLDQMSMVAADPNQPQERRDAANELFNVYQEKGKPKPTARERFFKGKGAAPTDAETPEALSAQDAQKALDASSAVLDRPENDPYMQMVDDAARNSPHNLSGIHGQEDAAEYMASFQAASANPDPLAPPAPPQVGYMPDDTSPRGRLRMLRDQAVEKFNDSAPGQFIGKKLSQASGNALTDSQGNVTYDPNTDPNTWAGQLSDGSPMPVRVVDGFEMAPEFQEAVESGSINTERLDKTLQRQQRENNKPLPEVAKKDRQQRRSALAGKAFGVLGTATMVAGMASQMDGQVGQIAQAALPALAGLSGIAPILAALPGPLAALVAVLGAAALSIFMLNKKFGDAQKETIAFTRAVGASKDSLKTLADYAGSVGSGEIMDKERESRFKLLEAASGKKTFGEGFVETAEGQAQVDALKTMVGTGGTDAAVAALTSQLSTAVISGILTPDQAASMAANLAYEVGNMELGIQVRANIVELVGPNGEDLSGGQIIEMGGNLVNQNMEALQSQMAMTQANLDSMAFGTQTERNVGLGGIVAAGAGGGAAAGAGVGAVLGSIIPGAGTAVGAGVGAVIGTIAGGISAAVGGYFAMQEAAEEAGRATGAIVGQAMNVLDTQQEISDSLDAYYLKKIEEAKVQGDIAESLRLQAEYEEKKVELSEQEMQMRDALRSTLEQGGDAAESARSGIKSAIETRFKDDSAAQLILPSIESSLNRMVKSDQITETDRDLINLELATTMDPATLSSLMMFVGEDGAKVDALVNVIGKFGGVFAGEAQNVLGLIEDESLKAQIFTEISSAGNEQEAQEILDFVREVSKQKGVFETDAIINFYNKNPEAKQELDDLFERVDTAGVQTVEQAYEVNPKLENPEAFDEAYFNMLPEGDKEQYVKTVSMFLAMEPEEVQATDSFTKWLNEPPPFGGQSYAQSSIPTQQAAYAQAMGYKVTQQLSTQDFTTGGEEEETPSGGGGGKEEGFDDLLVGLRNVRQATIDMKRGWDGMQESLQKFLDSGSTGFNGLSNQMRKFGVGESLIERIVGMDPDEYEKRKGELFTFDEAGNITGTTQKLQNMGAAMNKLALGEYVNSQQSFIENTKNQFTAMQMLTAQGLSFVEAYEMVQDQALATAIAMGATREEINELIRITEQMTQMQEKYNKLSEKEQAAKAVKESNKEFQKRVNILSKLSKEQGKYSDEEIDAVLNDPNLGTLFLNPKIDPKTLKQALENARRAADLELQIKVSTEEGKKGLFNELVGEVQDEFNRQEAKIDIDFRLANKADQDIVNEAQNRIAAIQYAIDDYEAQLKGIEDQEEVINEKYDDRYKALEEVAAANERINRLKAAELDVADALSRGDIAAAARAQQELRATEAQNRAESQKEMLQRQQEAELARVRSESGMSREELEKKIKGLQDEIFGIEETSLEPAQERIRLAEVQKQAQIDALNVSGKTRDEWDQIANLTDIATQNTDEFAKSVERALALYEYFVNGAPLDLSLFGEEMEAQLEALGVNVAEEKKTAAILDVANRAALEIDEDDEGLTEVQKMALRIQEINEALRDPSKQAQASGLRTADAIDNWGDAAVEQGRKNLIAEQRKLSAEFAASVGGGSADRLDQKYYQAVTSAGGTTNIGKMEKLDNNFAATYTSTQNSGSGRRGSSTPAKVTTTVISPGQQAPSSGRVIVNNSQLSNAAFASVLRRDDLMAARGRGSNSGGLIKPMKFSVGGKVKGYSAGGYGFGAMGSDNIPAILTPGEFVVRKRAVQDFGMKNLEKINNGQYSGGSVYNYSLAVNVKSDADPNKIAKTVMREIKRVDSQRVRGNRF